MATVIGKTPRPTASPTLSPSECLIRKDGSSPISRSVNGRSVASSTMRTFLLQLKSNPANLQTVKDSFESAFRNVADIYLRNRYETGKHSRKRFSQNQFFNDVKTLVKTNVFNKKASCLVSQKLDDVILKAVEEEFKQKELEKESTQKNTGGKKDDRSALSKEMQFLILMDFLISVGLHEVCKKQLPLVLQGLNSEGSILESVSNSIKAQAKTYGEVAVDINANFKGHWQIQNVELPEGWQNDNNKKMQVSIMLALSLVSKVQQRSPLDTALYPNTIPDDQLSEYLKTGDNLSQLVNLVMEIRDRKPEMGFQVPDFINADNNKYLDNNRPASYWERFHPGVGFIALGAALGYAVCSISNQSRPFPQDIEAWMKYTDCIARPFSRITRKCGDRPATSLTVTNDFMSQINGVMSQITGIMSQINISQNTWNSLIIGGMMFCTVVIIYVSKQAKQTNQTTRTQL